MLGTRKDFTHSSLLSKINSAFAKATRGLNKTTNGISLADCLMSGLAIFSLKYKSLLKFEEDKTSKNFVRHNIESLYGVSKVPCDTYLRERLDGLDLSIIRQGFLSLFSPLQRGKVLAEWKYLDGKFLVSLDASGFFSSNKIKCEYCCTKVTNKGTDKECTTYHHQMLIGSIVSPLMQQVLPIGFEPIIKADGTSKNDCERNCAKRWFEHFRKAHPRLPTIIVADGLYSNAPFIKMAQEKDCSFILVAKEDDHTHLYDYFWAGKGEDICLFESRLKQTKNPNNKPLKTPYDLKCSYRFMNDAPLNDTNHTLRVNVLHYKELNTKTNKETTWFWVTDINITRDNAKSIMQAGRSRWKIENETFNTLKNQGYNFEHNFGHGYKGLSNVLAGLMLLAFLTDQILEATNKEYQAAMQKKLSRSNFFEKTRAKFSNFMISSFERLYEAMILGPPNDRWL